MFQSSLSTAGADLPAALRCPVGCVMEDRLQRCRGSLALIRISIWQHCSPPLHDVVSSQLTGSDGISVLFAGLYASFSQATVDSKPPAVSPGTELNKCWSLSQKNRQYCFVSAFKGARQICQWKNVILTWGSLQVLHTWDLFDCTAYNYINSAFTGLLTYEYAWLWSPFFNPSKYLSSPGHKVLYTELVGWFYLLPHTSLKGKQTECGSKERVCSCKSSAELRAASVCPAHALQSSHGETHHQSRAPEILACQSVHAQLITKQRIWLVWSVPGIS